LKSKEELNKLLKEKEIENAKLKAESLNFKENYEKMKTNLESKLKVNDNNVINILIE